MAVPLPWATSTPAGSQWATTFTLQNDDGTVMNITGKTFELVVRQSPRNVTIPPLVSISSVAPSSQGSIIVNVPAGTVQTIVAPGALPATLANDVYTVGLWMDPGLTDATNLVNGLLYVQPTAAP
jgi:hypothetical protein